MARNREESWDAMYQLAVTYVMEHHQMPAKSNKEYANILNWWKYNRKKYNQGTLNNSHAEKLIELSKMRTIHELH